MDIFELEGKLAERERGKLAEDDICKHFLTTIAPALHIQHENEAEIFDVRMGNGEMVVEFKCWYSDGDPHYHPIPFSYFPLSSEELVAIYENERKRQIAIAAKEQVKWNRNEIKRLKARIKELEAKV